MNGKLKSLNINSVQRVAEHLMAAQGRTTTLEVKNKLRKDGFFALQEEVSTAMDFLAWENSWAFTCNGQYRTYHYGEDTNMALYCLMEKGDQFWEIAVKEKYQIIRIGKYQRKGKGIFTHRYESNRQAIAEANRLLKLRESEGYRIVKEQTDWARLMIEHFKYLEKQALQCTLFFHSITKIEEQKAVFSFNGLLQAGLIQTIKKAGYEFTFDLGYKDRNQLLKQLLQVPEWDAAKIYGASSTLLGEKSMSTQSMLFNGAPADGLPVKNYLSNNKVSSLAVATQNLYRIDFQFRDGTYLKLRKEQFDSEAPLFALAETFLRIS